MRCRRGRIVARLTGYRLWLGLATGLFVVWYVVFLFPRRLVHALSALTALAHDSLPLVPTVGVGPVRFVIETIVNLGLVFSVGALFVAFGLFTRQVDTR